MLKSFFLIFLLFIFKLIFFVLPFKTLSPFVCLFAYSFILFPIFCSLFKNKLFFYFKNNYFKICKIGLIKNIILISSGIFLMAPFCLMLKFNLNKILTALCFSAFATIWINICSFFAFLPVLSNKKIVDLILTSFKIAKKNYYKTFAATFKLYLAYFFILPFPFVLKKYVLTIKTIQKIHSSGDDEVKTHKLLSAIKTHS